MTTDDALERLARIGDMSGDDEAAHSEEDGFFADVLREVAGGNPYARDLAKIALRSYDIEFARWYS